MTQPRICIDCGAVSSAGPYQTERLLSRGPHGRLYLARDAGGEVVALKEFVFAVAPDVSSVDAFEREAKTLQTLTHPRIPRYVRSFQEGSGVSLRLYLAQEFIDGPTLSDTLAKKRFTEEDARKVALEVLEILQHLHTRVPRVLHRDIKPANVMMRADGSLVLVDFGTARVLHQEVTHGSTLVGTLGYMPFEQLGGTVDETSDLYALGATLVHLLSGKSPAEMLHEDGRLSYAAAVQVSASFKAFLDHLLSSKRADRFPSAKAALEFLLSGRRRARMPSFKRFGGAIAAGIAALTLFGVTFSIRVDAPTAGVQPSKVQPPASAARAPSSDTLKDEALKHLRAIFTAEKSFFAEKDLYSENFASVGFEPDPWCPDGARKSIAVPTEANRARGCHFIYEVRVTGNAPMETFTAFAHGQGLATGMDYEVTSNGVDVGILK